MNFSQFFITRPIFAGVLSALLLLVGGISLFRLPVSEYPEVAPPTVVVHAIYPGASPEVIAETVSTLRICPRAARLPPPPCTPVFLRSNWAR